MSFLIDRCDLRVVTGENGIYYKRARERVARLSLCACRCEWEGEKGGGNTWVKIIMRRSLTDVNYADCHPVVRTYVLYVFGTTESTKIRRSVVPSTPLNILKEYCNSFSLVAFRRFFIVNVFFAYVLCHTRHITYTYNTRNPNARARWKPCC